MNIQEIMDLMLKTGQEYVEKGKNIVEDRLDIPDDPNERKKMLSAAGKGALATGVIAALLGTKIGRKLTGTALKLGSLAAIGGLAYQTYNEWQQQNTGKIADATATPISELSGEAKEKRSLGLLKTMIAATQADGHIDDTERSRIIEQINALGLQSDTVQTIEQQLKESIDIKSIAEAADSPEAAAEMYLVSRIILDVDEPQERLFLNELADALGLESDLVSSLEGSVQKSVSFS